LARVKTSYKRIDWNELFKIRLASSDPSMDKHDIIKLMLVRKILWNHRKSRNFLRIYTEFDLDNGLICDVYFENMKTKEVIAYEVQKSYTKAWLKDRAEKYKDWEVPLFKTADWIPINLNDCPEKIDEINKWLEQYIV